MLGWVLLLVIALCSQSAQGALHTLDQFSVEQLPISHGPPAFLTLDDGLDCREKLSGMSTTIPGLLLRYTNKYTGWICIEVSEPNLASKDEPSLSVQHSSVRLTLASGSQQDRHSNVNVPLATYRSNGINFFRYLSGEFPDGFSLLVVHEPSTGSHPTFTRALASVWLGCLIQPDFEDAPGTVVYAPSSSTVAALPNHLSLSQISNLDSLWQARVGEIRWETAICPSLWRALVPHLNIQPDRPWQRAAQTHMDMSADEREKFSSNVTRYGYARSGPVTWSTSTYGIRSGMERLHDLGMPAAFVFVFDELWEMGRQSKDLIRTCLGDEAVHRPDFWAWVVRHGEGTGKGWRVHRDCGRHAIDDDGTVYLATTWIPLTDVTPDNACMYVLPIKHDPTYFKSNNTGDINTNRDGAKALPAAEGSVLMWNQNLVHWGGEVSEGYPARYSMSFEYARGVDKDRNHTPRGMPFLSLDTSPNFLLRLWMIARNVLEYRHLYHPDGQVIQFATNVLIELKRLVPDVLDHPSVVGVGWKNQGILAEKDMPQWSG